MRSIRAMSFNPTTGGRGTFFFHPFLRKKGGGEERKKSGRSFPGRPSPRAERAREGPGSALGATELAAETTSYASSTRRKEPPAMGRTSPTLRRARGDRPPGKRELPGSWWVDRVDSSSSPCRTTDGLAARYPDRPGTPQSNFGGRRAEGCKANAGHLEDETSLVWWVGVSLSDAVDVATLVSTASPQSAAPTTVSQGGERKLTSRRHRSHRTFCGPSVTGLPGSLTAVVRDAASPCAFTLADSQAGNTGSRRRGETTISPLDPRLGERTPSGHQIAFTCSYSFALVTSDSVDKQKQHGYRSRRCLPPAVAR
ncbi:hypothetical protein ACOMHN_002768 [Nucella lapillus]